MGVESGGFGQDGLMEIARLVLEYVRVLTWPLVVFVGLCLFTPDVKNVLKRLREASWGNASAKFEDAAREAEAQSIQVKEASVENPGDESAEGPLKKPVKEEEVGRRSFPGTERSGTPSAERPSGLTPVDRLRMAGALLNLRRGPEFGPAREVVGSSSHAAVFLAFRELETLSRDAYVAVNLGSIPPYGGVRLVQAVSPKNDATAVLVKRLTALRNGVAHDSARRVTVSGAIDYVEACENLATAILNVARSKLRHPARASLVIELAKEMGLAASELVPGFRTE